MGGRSKSRQGAILCVVSIEEYSKIRGWGSSGEFQNLKDNNLRNVRILPSVTAT